jgi:hypothetical protein
VQLLQAKAIGRCHLSSDLEPSRAERREIVNALFINTADENYIVARWCFAQQLNVDFFWLAVHALEKYFKAALVLNGRSAKGFNHDLPRLYREVISFASELMPSSLTKPPRLDVGSWGWGDEKPQDFIERLYRRGHANSRYQISGYYRTNEELFKLDHMVFSIRRACHPLDAHFIGDQKSEANEVRIRDILLRQPEHWRLGGRLEETIDGKRGKYLRRVLLNLNVPFAPADFKHRPMYGGFQAQNPILSLLVFNPLEEAPDSPKGERAARIRDWVLQNIDLGRPFERELQAARDKRRKTR